MPSLREIIVRIHGIVLAHALCKNLQRRYQITNSQTFWKNCANPQIFLETTAHPVKLRKCRLGSSYVFRLNRLLWPRCSPFTTGTRTTSSFETAAEVLLGSEDKTEPAEVNESLFTDFKRL